MSTAAVNRFPVATGATARALPGITPGTGPSRKARTPLSLVRSAPRKRRAPFVVLCFGILAVALMAVLVLNISVSTAQYQLVQLRSEQSTLTKQNQDLTQQVQNFDAPQNLAAKATELGMVASTGKGQIDLSTLTVTGKAKPAVKGDAPGAVIAAPAVAGQLSVVPPATVKEPLANRKPAAAADAGRSAPQLPRRRRPPRTGRRGRAGPGRPPPRPHRRSNSTEAPFPPPRRRSRDSNAGRTTSQASSKEIIVAQNTGKARKAKVPNATRRLRLGLGVMLTLLLVVGGKLFLVQGLDVGGMAEAALQNRLTPIELPGRTRQHPGRQRHRPGQQRDPLQRRRGPDGQHQDRDVPPAGAGGRQGRARQGLPGPGHLRARRRAGHGPRTRSRTP